MNFKEYLQKFNESNPEKRIASGPYARLYPKQYGLSYKMQYNPKSLKESINQGYSSRDLYNWHIHENKAGFWLKEGGKPFEDGSLLKIDGIDYVVVETLTPEDMHNGRGGPIAKRMKEKGYSHNVRLKTLNTPNYDQLSQVDQTNIEPAQSFTYLGGHGT